jgi:putative ABC transport system permease protein
MIYLDYMLSELRRRKGRTLLTALGLGVGVALVITVSALSAGLDRAQAKVLEPLVGVGTDMSVTRPIVVSSSSSSSSGGPPQLSAKERAQLQKENGDQRVGFGNLKAGQKFKRTSFSSTQLSFTAAQVAKISKLDGVAAAAGGLTLNLTTVSGTVPERTQQDQRSAGPPLQGGGGFNGPRSVDFASLTVSGIDQTKPALAAISASQLTKGTYFSSGSAREAIVNVSYARAKGVKVGSSIKLGGKSFTVIGIVKTPLGGQASDAYVKLTQLQKLSGRTGRVNTIYVRATSASVVDHVADEIRSTFSGASVTTAKTLAAQITGSLASAKSLTSKLGFALELIGLFAAMAIAALLTLASVTKRVRELGTLKAVGWPQRLVVRQVTGEALLQSMLGAAVGIAVGIGAAVGISAFAPSLTATVTSAAQSAFGPGPFGQGALSSSSGSEAVSLSAHVSPMLVLAAVGLALLGGLVSGAVGGLRASRLRPADALRQID